MLAVGTGAALLVLGIVLWAVGTTRRQRVRARRIRPQRAGRKGVEAPAAWGPPPRHAIGFEPAEPGGPSTSDRPHPLPPLTGGGPAEPPPPPPTEPVAPPQPPPAAPVPPRPPPGAPAPPAPPAPVAPRHLRRSRTRRRTRRRSRAGTDEPAGALVGRHDVDAHFD